MKTLIHSGLGIAILSAGLLVSTAHKANAQVSVEIGTPPVCPYGYYEVPPYNCAPDGYYGPEWFSGGIFIGAGPPGSTGRIISTATLITVWIFAKATAENFPRAASIRRITGRSFTVRQCMMHAATKPP